MTKADSVLSTQGEPAPEFDNLAAAVSPMWHPAVPKLAGATERVASRLEFWGASNNTSGSFVRAARDLAKELIDFLDLIGGDPDFENELLDDDSEELEIDHPGGEDGTAEPSPGSIELHRACSGTGGTATAIKPGGLPATAPTWRRTTTPASAIKTGWMSRSPFRDWQSVGMV